MGALRRFTQSARGTVDSTGAAQVQLGPVRTDWLVTRVSVTYTPPPAVATPKQPSATLYADLVTPSHFIEDTGSGNADVSDTRHLLHPNDLLVMVWAGADPPTGGVAGVVTMQVSGVEYDQGSGLDAYA